MIGLIFGETEFPKYILKKIKNKYNHLIIDFTKKKIFKNNKNSYSVSLGQFGKVISILKSNNCKKVLFAGKINKPNFKSLKLDFKGIYYMPQIIKSSKLGDAAILKQVIKILKAENIETLSPKKFTPELCLKRGNYSKFKINKNDKKDILCGLRALRKSGVYSHTQGVVTRNEKVVALEASDGTEKMLKRIKKIPRTIKGLLIKYPKKKQDLRIDLPTIGLQTLKQCKKAGLKGIVLKHKMNIFLNKSQSIKFANKNRMVILVR